MLWITHCTSPQTMAHLHVLDRLVVARSWLLLERMLLPRRRTWMLGRKLTLRSRDEFICNLHHRIPQLNGLRSRHLEKV